MTWRVDRKVVIWSGFRDASSCVLGRFEVETLLDDGV